MAGDPVAGVGNRVDLFDKNFDELTRAMQVSSLRQAVISHNIANAKTPGYLAQEFDAELMQAVNRLDKKQVVLEEELSSLAKNSMDYSSYVKLLSSKINNLKTIAGQGRR